jgi:hypothetical protein
MAATACESKVLCVVILRELSFELVGHCLPLN